MAKSMPEFASPSCVRPVKDSTIVYLYNPQHVLWITTETAFVFRKH